MDALVYCNDKFWSSSQWRIGSWAGDHGYEIVGKVQRARSNRIDSLKEAVTLAQDRGWKLIVYGSRPLFTADMLRLLVGVDFVCPELPDVTPKQLPRLIRAIEKDPGLWKQFGPGWKYRGNNVKRREHLVKARKEAARARKAAAEAGYKTLVPIIQERRKAGYSYQRIADYLNERGYFTSEGRQFLAKTVHRIDHVQPSKTDKKPDKRSGRLRGGKGGRQEG